MNSVEAKNNLASPVFPAKVVKIINDSRIVINRGEEHGIRKGMKTLIYNLSDEEIKDLDTGESLGYLEIVKGTGVVTHIQPKISTIESDKKVNKTRTIISQRTLARLLITLPEEEIVESSIEIVPFENPEVGDMVKPI
jgi:hypothetical protein